MTDTSKGLFEAYEEIHGGRLVETDEYRAEREASEVRAGRDIDHKRDARRIARNLKRGAAGRALKVRGDK